MKIRWFHIFLSLLLTLAVNDYIWIELLEDEYIVLEVEKEEKEELREELRESKSDEFDNFSYHSSVSSYSFIFQNIASGIVKHGNSFRPIIKSNDPSLYILFCQLRLDC
ncbi:MAG: hypothetical protein ABJF11_12615 [Reichenbachiella sp.]|uniref:hypothetical protein n=1 Tax=Reichenbachiella sp. TaxID=2184521 RepID=UPI003262D2CB